MLKDAVTGNCQMYLTASRLGIVIKKQTKNKHLLSNNKETKNQNVIALVWFDVIVKYLLKKHCAFGVWNHVS